MSDTSSAFNFTDPRLATEASLTTFSARFLNCL